MPLKGNPPSRSAQVVPAPARRCPTLAAWQAALAPYADPRGGYRCPACGAPLRLLDVRPAAAFGCPCVRDLAQLVLAAAGAGHLLERPPATFAELHARTPSLTGPQRAAAFAALPVRVQAALWRTLDHGVRAA